MEMLAVRTYFVSWLFFISFVKLHVDARRVQRGFCSKANLDIPNGDYRIFTTSSVVKYTCNPGFILYGAEQLVCFGTKWSSDPPMCIANTCSPVSPTETLRIEKAFDGAILKFSCSVLHQLKGAQELICDGRKWNAPPPTCEPWSPPKSCDFEDGLCGWHQHDKDEQDWTLHTGSTRTTRTGPEHDHTIGENGQGHYVYFETSSPTRPRHRAILESPLYPAEYSYECFNFWYHLLGERDIGSLKIYIKPDSNDGLKGLSSVFTVDDSMGTDWLEHNITIDIQREPFQIWMVATRGASYRSDMAIDDVRLVSCGRIPPTVQTTTSRPITAVTTTPRTTRSTTILRSTSSTTTRRPVTSSTQTPSTPNQPRTTRPRPQTDTTRGTRITSSSTSATPRQTTSQSTMSSASKRVSTHRTKAVTTGPDLIPNSTESSATQALQAADISSGASGKLVYIFIGVGLVVLIAVAVGIGIVLYRKKQLKEKTGPSLSSSNPLYCEIENQEAMVKFFNEEGDHSYEHL